jgi:site-specific DNA-methyltransferase (adenine-specific)
MVEGIENIELKSEFPAKVDNYIKTKIDEITKESVKNGKKDQWKNQLWFGDNLDVMRKMPSDYVDLIYLDPPFNSDANYNLLVIEKDGSKSKSQIKVFEDTWTWGEDAQLTYHEIMTSPSQLIPDKLRKMIAAMREYIGECSLMAYLVNMAIRLCEMRRLLKESGSIYLHCDPTASHYLKIMMDAIYGPINFRNEIVWCYSKWTNKSTKFQQNHDIILSYGKTKDTYFNPLYTITKRYQKSLDMGYGTNVANGVKQVIVYDDNKIDEAKKKYPDYKLVIAKNKGVLMSDWWEIPILNSMAKERLGYPTQKPEALIERIIQASCPLDGIVLDPFCGCGTTVSVAQRSNIKWIGIDITHIAIGIIRKRLVDNYGKIDLEVHGEPKDVTSALKLAEEDKYQFQWWFVDALGGIPAQDKKKGADGGVDGIIYYGDDPKDPLNVKKIIISVKGGNTKPSDVRDLAGTVKREKAMVGVFATAQKPTSDMIKEANSHLPVVWQPDPNEKPIMTYPEIQIISIEDYFNGKRIKYPDVRFIGMYGVKK